MYAYYKDCDPYTAKVIRRRDQLLPYYVLDVAGNLLGLPGLFISGVFSTALRFVQNYFNLRDLSISGVSKTTVSTTFILH